ncbi:prepilin peptidase [Nocardioides donggukensis]|uniref:Prepilin peptidase n=1 Tax=Nocardioides donggukensis TaxID=2774019 RepID=A0A927K8T6_9ACTN|nr:A24 family peptidase [Nocardioides donggukensis]MBD8869755.1 prepilin peptidase [Nocardioides donggukensis]
MDWLLGGGWHADTAAVCAVVGALGGWLVPRLVARIPEPVAVPAGPAGPAGPDPAAHEEEPRPSYVELAAAPGLAQRSAVGGALVGGVIGAATGWIWPLTYLLVLVPIGLALGYVDSRVRLLPTKVIAPTYGVVAALVLLCAAVTGDLDDLGRAALGWLVFGLVFWLLWRFTPGMGYGDVRLSGILGIALGYLGWSEALVGLYSGFLLGSVGWIPLRLLRITKDRNFPFGPFMLIGALVGIVWGPEIGEYLAARRA